MFASQATLMWLVARTAAESPHGVVVHKRKGVAASCGLDVCADAAQVGQEDLIEQLPRAAVRPVCATPLLVVVPVAEVVALARQPVWPAERILPVFLDGHRQRASVR